MLVDQCGLDVGVAESVHQFGEGGACLGGEGCAGVSEVVPAEIRASGDSARSSVDLVQGGVFHVVAGLDRREEQAVGSAGGEVLEMGFQHGQEVWWHGDVADAGVCLGRFNDWPTGETA